MILFLMSIGYYLWNMGAIFDFIYDKLDEYERKDYSWKDDFLGFEDDRIMDDVGTRTQLLWITGLFAVPIIVGFVETMIYSLVLGAFL